MNRSIKVALLSGLVFPGIGHMVLKQYLRGWILMLAALAAMSAIVIVTTRRALVVIDGMASGEIPVDTAAISELVSNSISSSDNFIANTSLLVLAAAWLIGIIDSYRLGMIQENTDKMRGT
jgi:hypothetical protein